MKTLYFVSILLFLTMAILTFGQENTSAPQRTPEQEALKQTDKLQQELNLSPDQTKQIYDINLRYARERQTSNKRSEAVERMKNKNADIQQVLSQEQNDKLQTKRYERSTPESNTVMQNRPVNPPGFRSNSDFRSNPSTSTPSNDAAVRSTFRSSNPSNSQNNSQPQAVRKTTSNESAPRINPSTVHHSFGAPTIFPKRTETPATPSRK
ncbi:MAG: hypothetical protein WCG08_04710 [Paludibacter sp.]